MWTGEVLLLLCLSTSWLQTLETSLSTSALAIPAGVGCREENRKVQEVGRGASQHLSETRI